MQDQEESKGTRMTLVPDRKSRGIAAAFFNTVTTSDTPRQRLAKLFREGSTLDDSEPADTDKFEEWFGPSKSRVTNQYSLADEQMILVVNGQVRSMLWGADHTLTT